MEGQVGARLNLEIDSTQPATAATNLDRMAESSGRAETAAAQLAAEARAAMAGLGGLGSAASGTNAALGAVGRMLDLVDATLSDVAAANRAAAGGADVATTAFQNEAQAAQRTGGALRDMADAIRAEDAALKEAARTADAAAGGMKRVETATAGAGKQAQATAVHFDTLYEEMSRDFATQYGLQMNRVGTANGKAAGAMKLTVHESLNLTRNLADVGVQAAMLQNPLMILIQQGPQIADIFQTAAMRGVGFKAVLGDIIGMVGRFAAIAGPIALVAGALAGLAYFANKGNEESVKLNNTLAVTGHWAGLNADQFEKMAASSAKYANQTVGNAREVGMVLLQSGKVGGEAMRLLTGDILKLADYTGKSRTEIANQFAGMGDDVTAFAKKLNEQYHFIDLAQLLHIKRLQEQGDTTRAQLALAVALHVQLGTVAPVQLGHVERAWRDVKNSIDGAIESLMRWGRTKTLQERLDRVNENLSIRESLAGPASSRDPNGNAAKEIEKVRREKLFLEQQIIGEWGKAQLKSAGSLLDQQAMDAFDRHNRQWATLGDNAAAATKEIGEFRQTQAALIAEADRKGVTDAKARNDMGIVGEARAKEIELEITKKYTPAATAAARASDQAAESAANRATRLADEARAVEATIEANYRLADAYRVSDAAALRAKAETEAVGKAIKAGADTQAYVDRQVRLSISERLVAGAKLSSDMRQETAARRAVNDQVAAGLITGAEADRQLRNEAQVRPLIAALAEAEGVKKLDLLAAIVNLRHEQKAANDEDQRAAKLARDRQTDNTLATLKLERELIGAGNRERAIRLAQLQAEQEIRGGRGPGYVFTDDEKKRVKDAVDTAGDQASLAVGQDLYNASLDRTLDRLTRIDEMASSAGDQLASAFNGASESAGRFIRSLNGIIGAVNKLAVIEERANRERQDSWKGVLDAMTAAKPDYANLMGLAGQYADVSKKTAREMEDAQVGAYASMAGSAKTFFKEGSDGYKALQAVEIGFRAVQFALSVQAMGQSAAETAAHTTNAMSRAVASTIAGAARAFEQLGVWGFVGAAGIIAFMAAMGVSAGGGAGGASYDLEGVQGKQGTGTVLGDANAKSESIANSLELVADHTNEMLEYNSGMLRALRNIDTGIENLTAAIARNIGVGGFLTGKGIDRTTNVNNGLFRGGSLDKPVTALGGPGAFDPLGLWDTKTARKLVDAGLRFANQTLADALTQGLDAATFQTIQTTTTQKVLGMFSKVTTKSRTTTGDLDPDVERQLALVLGSLRDGVLAAAAVLGVEGAGAVLDAFKLNIGQLSFKDMTGDEIEKTLQAVFSAVGDDMAAAVIPGLADLQKAGEGTFETLIRVARQYEVVNVGLASIGMTFGAVGLSSLAARERLVNLVGGLDAFIDKTSFYAENFLTEAERLAPIQSALNAELARLGITGLDTRDEFKALVQGLDLSTAAGAELFAALMAIAPAFAAVTEETKAVADARDALSDAYDRESSALEATRDRFADIAKSLGEFRTSLYSGPSAALTPEQQYAASRAEFERVAALASQGNEQALGDLENVSQAYLDASRDYYASSAGYFADLEAVRAAVTAAETLAGDQVDVAQAQLDELKALVAGILDLNETTLTVAQALAAYQAAIANALGAGGQTPVVVTPTGVVVPAPTGTTPTTATPEPIAPPPPATGGANDNSDLTTRLDALVRLQEQTARDIAELRAETQAANRQRGAVAAATLKQGQQMLDVQDQTVTALRAKA